LLSHERYGRIADNRNIVHSDTRGKGSDYYGTG